MPDRCFTGISAVGPKRLPELIRLTREVNRLLHATAVQIQFRKRDQRIRTRRSQPNLPLLQLQTPGENFFSAIKLLGRDQGAPEAGQTPELEELVTGRHQLFESACR